MSKNKTTAVLSETAINKLPYRPCVGLLVLNTKGEVFVAQRNDMRSEAWQMPQGGIDKGEAPRDAALRELEEEIGTADAEILAESADWHSYDLPRELVGRLWKGRYRGQTQKWFALRLRGGDETINIETEHPEFSAWKWVGIGEVAEFAVPFKRDLYRKIIEEFRHLAA
ncbi:RNA pyrophosphohydrolase [Pelagibius sp. Alg239-R121]|uniref:RNA pyrophosphohydrolase n=1 Tax=Pelagibius sp. Alg239-R121 TaxID=2993448 RepID=UPI0024A62D27|nr:RNA pyrophosphohydrolase [Pelagibius sp. Alg239-R121]